MNPCWSGTSDCASLCITQCLMLVRCRLLGSTKPPFLGALRASKPQRFVVAKASTSLETTAAAANTISSSDAYKVSDPAFYDIIRQDEPIRIVAEKDYPFAHEAGVALRGLNKVSLLHMYDQYACNSKQVDFSCDSMLCAAQFCP